jgi:uncharacterized membrane protein
MATVIGIFETYDQANDTVAALEESGIDRDEIGVLGQEKVLRTDTPTETAAGATSGAVLGGIAGLIAGIAGVTLPGIGAVLGTSLLSNLIGTAAAGAGAGAVAGGALGALTDLGAPPERIELYEAALGKGQILIAVRTPNESSDEVLEILANHGGQNVRVYVPEAGHTTGP